MQRFFIILVILVFDIALFSQQSSLTPSFLSKAKYVNYFTKIPSPSIYRDHNSLSKIQTLNISAIYVGAWPSEAQNAFNYALNIWSYLINSTIPIKIKAEWVPLDEGILAETYLTSNKKNFINAPVADINFPVSLAEALSGTELNGSEEEINIKVSSDFSWYYGIDGNTPSEKHDLVSVILHEVTHGLGFSHSMQVENNIGSWGQNYRNNNEKGFAQYYEKFGVVGPNSTTIYRLTNTNQYPNPSGELANALQSINVYFDGTITKQMYFNNLPKLYAPNPFEGGSTLAHFDEDTFPAGNQNSLMSPQLGMAESIHSPGELGLAVLQDLGWNVNRLITILSPQHGIAYMPSQTKEIKWIDNIGGAISIDLLKKDAFGNYEYYSTIASHPSPRSVNNSINWTIPNVEGTFRIRMIDNTFSGEGFGLSYPFIISNQAQVATPVILPAGNNYLTPQLITISCVTPEATIYYTTDNSEPSSTNGTEYSTSFSINSDMIIKAIAIKSGFPDSEIKSETYTFGTMPPPATIIPASGQYPVPITIEVNWQSNVEGYVAYTNDGSEPIDPKTAGWEIPFNRPWRITYPYENTVIKINARTKLNGVWGPLVQRTYDLKPALRIAQIDDEITQGNNSFGEWNKWENNLWNPHPDETIVRPTQTSDWYLKALQDFKDPANNVFRKYNVWTTNLGTNEFVNHAKITVGATTSSVLAHFKQSYDVTVTNKLENSFSVNQGSFIIKNPWIVDDNSDSKGPRNRGDGAVVPLSPYTINFSTTPNITTGSIHKGVFLNQGITPQGQWQPPYYSIKVDQQILNITLNTTGVPSGRNHKFYFQNWSGTNVNFQNANALETPVVFTSDGAVAQAKYKGTQLSDNAAAYSNNSQRKFLRTSYGVPRLHSVYESMGRVWYETSTDNGSTWIIMNQGKPLSEFPSKCPSISPLFAYDDDVLITFQEYHYGDYNDFSRIKVLLYIPSYDIIRQDLTPEGFEFIVNSAVNPVIQANQNTDKTNILLICEIKNDLNPFGGYPNGFYYLVGKDNASFTGYDWTKNSYDQVLVTHIDNTDANSYTPCLTQKMDHYELPTIFHLVWEQRTSASISVLRYYKIQAENNNTVSFPVYNSNLSNGSGYQKNYAPSLVTLNNGVVKAVWQGARQVTADENPTGPQHINALTNWEYKTVYKDLTTGTQKTFGTRTNPPTINKLDGNSRFYITYSEQSSLSGKLVEGTYMREITDLGITGRDIQTGNGTATSNTYAMAFNSSNLPFYFRQSQSFVNILPRKKNILSIQSGREGVVYKDTAQFYFAVGDVIVNNIPVAFIPLQDSIQTNTEELVNTFLETEPFALSDNSVFFYSVQYGITDSAAAVQLLSENKSINFKVELIDVATGSIIGSFDNVTYSENGVFLYNNIAYQVNTAGLSNTQVKLRLAISTSGEFDYSLTERFAEETVLGKSSIKQINLDGSGIVKEYALAQNFPNPFNPSTTISYQIPQEGIVTLKVYDILGSEVATLVNEEKVAGKYEVNFNASALASGVYIYKIQSGSFINSKKMILLK